MSGSKSNTSQATTSTDNRRVIGENGISAEGSNVTVTNNTLDAEVLNRALDSVDNITGDAFGFGKSTLTSMGNVFSDALASNESAVKQVLTYGMDTTNRAYDNVDETTNLVKDAYADAKGRGALTDQILIGAIAAMALIAYMAVRK